VTSMFGVNLVNFNEKIIPFTSCMCCSFLFLYVLDLEGLQLVVQ
jgi:hypothetical protein